MFEGVTENSSSSPTGARSLGSTDTAEPGEPLPYDATIRVVFGCPRDSPGATPGFLIEPWFLGNVLVSNAFRFGVLRGLAG